MQSHSACCCPKPITPPPFITKGIPEVIIVSIPDNKEALYIDGKLVREDRWISVDHILDALVKAGFITGGRRYAETDVLNDVGQFSRYLDFIIREKRYQ